MGHSFRESLLQRSIRRRAVLFRYRYPKGREKMARMLRASAGSGRTVFGIAGPGSLALPAEPVDVLLGDAFAGGLRLLDRSELEDSARIDHAAPGGRSRPKPGDPAKAI